MANTYYNSSLDSSEIEAALEAIDGVIAPANNGKVLVIDNGKIAAKSVTEIAGGGGSVVLESLSVSANGDYFPGSGVDGFNEVHVSVSGGQSYLANWDFTQSLTDTIGGLVATLNGGASRDSSGVHIAAVDSYISIPFKIFPTRWYEIDIGDMSYGGESGVNHRFFMFAQGGGFIYRTTGEWSFYDKASSGTWATGSGITDFDFFKNSTVKIYVDENRYFHVYKNGSLVYEPNRPAYDISQLTTSLFVGGSSGGLGAYNCVIEALRIY